MKTTIFSQVSIDGKLTLGEGNSSKELFNLLDTEDFEFIHKFRGQVDGIMVGRKTIEIDNPFLTNRYEYNKNPVRIVTTASMNISLDSNILNDGEKTIIVTTEQGARSEKFDYINKLKNKKCIICGKQSVGFSELFKLLENKFSIKSIMVEGGGQMNWNIIKEGLVDEIILMQLPNIIGGSSNVTLVDGEGYTKLSDTKNFELCGAKPSKNYILLRYKRK